MIGRWLLRRIIAWERRHPEATASLTVGLTRGALSEDQARAAYRAIHKDDR